MLKLEVIFNEYANYILKDKDGNEYEVNINFIDIDKPKIGTIIYIQKSVLDEKVSLNYGLVDKDSINNEDEIIMLSEGEKKKYLQRFYG